MVCVTRTPLQTLRVVSVFLLNTPSRTASVPPRTLTLSPDRVKGIERRAELSTVFKRHQLGGAQEGRTGGQPLDAHDMPDVLREGTKPEIVEV